MYFAELHSELQVAAAVRTEPSGADRRENVLKLPEKCLKFKTIWNTFENLICEGIKAFKKALHFPQNANFFAKCQRRRTRSPSPSAACCEILRAFN